MRYLIVVLLLTGCATNVAELHEIGEKHRAVSVQSPERAAGCVARNLEIIWNVAPSIRTAKQPGAWEVVVNIQQYSLFVAYVLVEPAPNGSALTLTMASVNSSFAPKALEGC